MRLGLIARADNTGLGVQTVEYFRHLNPAKTLVIDVGHFADDSKHCNKHSHRDRYPGAQFYCGWLPPETVLADFLDSLDVVLGAETMYNPNIYHMARERGIRTVVAPNWEFFDTTAKPDLWIAPTEWHYGHMPEPKTVLPVPIATDRLKVRELPDVASHFLHIAGRPAVHDRNGTFDLIQALQHAHTPITVTIKCQDPTYIGERTVPKHIRLNVDTTNVDNYWDNYRAGDVLVMPRRYGGLCLPMQEAIGVGMPVIMPNISPNNTLPNDWLVPAHIRGNFRAKQRIDYYSVDHKALAAKIDQLATDADFYTAAKTQAAQLREQLSWDNLRSKYEKVISG